MLPFLDTWNERGTRSFAGFFCASFFVEVSWCEIFCARLFFAARSTPRAPGSASGSVGLLPVAAAVESAVGHAARGEDGGYVLAGGGDPDDVRGGGRVDSLPMYPSLVSRMTPLRPTAQHTLSEGPCRPTIRLPCRWTPESNSCDRCCDISPLNLQRPVDRMVRRRDEKCVRGDRDAACHRRYSRRAGDRTLRHRDLAPRAGVAGPQPWPRLRDAWRLRAERSRRLRRGCGRAEEAVVAFCCASRRAWSVCRFRSASRFACCAFRPVPRAWPIHFLR